jgi:glycosyltransferase involved in cell wall biosynthesis
MSERSVSSVGHVLWSGTVGGIERLVRDLAAEQVRQGLRVVVAFGRAEGPFVGATRRAGAEVVDLRFANGYDLRPLKILRGARALRSADVVHLHGFNLPLACIALASRRPLVFTEHGNFALGRSLRPGERVKRKLQSLFLDRGVSCLAANSRHTASRLAELYSIFPQRINVIHNGAEFGAVERQSESGRANGQLRVVFVGRLVRFKRVDRLIEGVARCRWRDRLRVAIIGVGPLEPALQAFADSSGLGDSIRFLGYRADIPAALADADVLVQPSEGEPFGLTIIEACGQGLLPIVFSDGGGALEALPPDGVVVDDAEGLAAALDGLIGSPALSAKARAARAHWVRGRFPISQNAQRYQELYEAAKATC